MEREDVRATTSKETTDDWKTRNSIKLFIKGWSLAQFSVTSEELRRRFEGVPGIARVEEVTLGSKRTFAHARVVSERSPAETIENLSRLYGKAMWKGGYLTFEEAKPDYRERLRSLSPSSADAVQQPTSLTTTTTTWNETTKLRLRKKRGRKGIIVVIPAKCKRRRFAQGTGVDVDDDRVALSRTSKERMATSVPMKITEGDAAKINHLLSYCCTQDAGPNFSTSSSSAECDSRSRSEPAADDQMDGDLDDDGEEGVEKKQHNEELVSFVAQSYSSNSERFGLDGEVTEAGSKPKRKKHLPGSLLYDFRKAMGLLTSS